MPGRIVSLVPSHTESLHDLGLADRVVGRTRFCVAPRPWVDGLAVVGGTKDATAARIMALDPDLVVADKDENPKDLIDQLLDADVPVLWSEIDTVLDAAAFLEMLGERCGAPREGRREAEAIREVLARPTGPPLPVFCPIWHAPWMTFDRTAYPHAMLEAAGFLNVFADHRGPKYFEVGPEEVRIEGAAWTLLPTEPFPFHKQRDRIDTTPFGPAGAPDRVHVIDGEALTWFGTRTVRGLAELRGVAERLRAIAA